MLNFVKNIYHFCLAWLGKILYGFPSRKIFVVGVTGTKGKSTTVELINAILEAAGKKTALLSSVRFKVDKSVEKNRTSMTMPGRFAIQRFLRKAVNVGCEYAIIEVTSQGILQHRHRFIDWNAVLFLNLRPEHIEAHGSFENYRDSKVKFFADAANYSRKKNKLFFINEGSPNHQHFVDAIHRCLKISCGPGNCRCGFAVYFSRENFIEKELNNGKEKIGDWLENDFNLENAAAAASFAASQGIQWPAVKKALANFKGVPGRMEVVQEKPFRVVIDYAHTPDSLEKIYQALDAGNDRNDRVELFKRAKRSIINPRTSNLICVLGAAGGGRDKWKRPEMGKIAAEYCREIILTDEDPYDENPNQILADIRSGIKNASVHEVFNRKEAIKKSISLAKKGDTVIITGKGSEDWIHIARGKKIPWNERQVVEEILGK